LFRTRSGNVLCADSNTGQFWLGRMGEEMTDEVVVALKRLHPVPWIEVHTHGGREVMNYLLDLLRTRGLTVCSWQEFLRHTGDDPLRTEAAIALAQATTARTAAILLDQHAGALGEALDAILSALEGNDPGSALTLLKELAKRTTLGRHLIEPWRVVIAGAPNVGKSSLVNALAGYQRSIVDPTPGTTRDVVTTRLAIDGWPIELIDTAGLRTGAQELEEEGIRLARATLANADLCLYLLDASAEPIWPDACAPQLHLVVNKVDLAPRWDLAQAGNAVPVSARTRAGLADLCTALSRWLVPNPPGQEQGRGVAIPFTEPLCRGVEEAVGEMEAGRVKEAKERIVQLRAGRLEGL
jgi:tRNA modification GTPase